MRNQVFAFNPLHKAELALFSFAHVAALQLIKLTVSASTLQVCLYAVDHLHSKCTAST